MMWEKTENCDPGTTAGLKTPNQGLEIYKTEAGADSQERNEPAFSALTDIGLNHFYQWLGPFLDPLRTNDENRFTSLQSHTPGPLQAAI